MPHRRDAMKIVTLVSSVGRRGQLVECLRRSISTLGFQGTVIGVDCSRLAPAAHLVDEFYQVPRCDDSEFLARMLAICTENNVRLLIPTIDTELPLYAANREAFAAIGTNVAISGPKTIEIASDKTVTNRWLLSHSFPTVRQANPHQVLSSAVEWKFPLIVKPRRGSASVGVRIVHTREMLRGLADERSDLAVEQIALGQEYTINVLVNHEGICACAVPHIRLEVRGGEVSKGVTCKNREIMELIARVSEQLPDAWGPLNVQGFLSPDQGFLITEINARFGGGYPLAHKAGAEFTRWLLEESLGMRSSASFDCWQDGLAMLRYDSAVFLPYESAGSHEQ